MRVRIRSWLLLAGALMWPWSAAWTEQPGEHINGYVFGLRAERAEQGGNLDEAFRLYSESLRWYQETARLHPEWNPALVQERINETGNDIERLKRLLAAAAEEQRQAEKDALRIQVDQLVAEARAEWEREKGDLQERIAALEASLAEAVEDAASASADLAAARQQAASAVSAGAALEQEVASLRAGMTALQTERDGLSAALAEKDSLISGLKEQLDRPVKPLISEEELAALRKERDARNREVEALKRRIDELEPGAASAERLGKELDEAVSARSGLERDLEKLRSERDAAKESFRSLQDQARKLSEELEVVSARAVAADRLGPLERQVDELGRERAELREQLDRRTGELAAKDAEIDGLAGQVRDLQEDAGESARREELRQRELDEARAALDKAKALAGADGSAGGRMADYEKAAVENFALREASVVLSNRLQQASAQAANAIDRLALEQKKWNKERERWVEQVDALKETVDLNQAELEKAKDMRATIKALEKENRKLSRRVSFGDDQPADLIDQLEQRISELEAELEKVRTTSQP